MRFGLTDLEFLFINEKLILPLKEKKAKVFLFGSRANGKFKKFSDIDLFYVPSADRAIPANFIYKLLSEVEESSFPYKIDLVNYFELASSYKKNVDTEKLEL